MDGRPVIDRTGGASIPDSDGLLSTVGDALGTHGRPSDYGPSPSLADAVRAATDGIVLIDGRGIVLYCDEFGAELLGEAPERLVGAPFPHHLEVGWTEIEAPGPNGDSRVLGSHARWTGDDLAVISLHDLSRYRQLAADSEATVIEQVLTVAATAHEMRSPLAAITLTAETLKEMPGGPGSGAGQELLDRIIGESRYLGHLVRGLQIAFRSDAVSAVAPRDRVDLASLLRSGFARKPQWADGLVVDCPSGLTVCANANQVWLMVSNCVENAFRHAQPPVEVRGQDARNRTEIHVSDHGPGVPDDFVAHLFEPFATGPSSGPALDGAGLGLSIVRGLARAAGGDCWCEARPGGGARFVISLPNGGPA